MTLGTLLKEGREILQNAGIAEWDLDAWYLLEYVTTEGATFHWMKQKGIPCERTYFYEVRRYFYYLMAHRI